MRSCGSNDFLMVSLPTFRLQLFMVWLNSWQHLPVASSSCSSSAVPDTVCRFATGCRPVCSAGRSPTQGQHPSSASAGLSCPLMTEHQLACNWTLNSRRHINNVRTPWFWIEVQWSYRIVVLKAGCNPSWMLQFSDHLGYLEWLPLLQL